MRSDIPYWLNLDVPFKIAYLQDWGRPSNKFPSKIPVLIQFLESWARPAAIFQLERLVRRLTRKKKRRRILTTISQSGMSLYFQSRNRAS